MSFPPFLLEFRDACVAQGLDLVHAFGAEHLRSELASLQGHAPRTPRPTAAIVANTRALWTHFKAALDASECLRAAEHPLDSWVEARVLEALSGVAIRHEVVWAHRPIAGTYAPIQRWAAESGMATLAPCHMLVHHQHGLWVGLRCLILFDHAWSGGVQSAEDPCATCLRPCLQPFGRAEARSRQYRGRERVTAVWRDWLAVRDACPIGKESRYGNEQIIYHYTRDTAILDGTDAAVRGRRNG